MPISSSLHLSLAIAYANANIADYSVSSILKATIQLCKVKRIQNGLESISCGRLHRISDDHLYRLIVIIFEDVCKRYIWKENEQNAGAWFITGKFFLDWNPHHSFTCIQQDLDIFSSLVSSIIGLNYNEQVLACNLNLLLY